MQMTLPMENVVPLNHKRKLKTTNVDYPKSFEFYTGQEAVDLAERNDWAYDICPDDGNFVFYVPVTEVGIPEGSPYQPRTTDYANDDAADVMYQDIVSSGGVVKSGHAYVDRVSGKPFIISAHNRNKQLKKCAENGENVDIRQPLKLLKYAPKIDFQTTDWLMKENSHPGTACTPHGLDIIEKNLQKAVEENQFSGTPLQVPQSLNVDNWYDEQEAWVKKILPTLKTWGARYKDRELKKVARKALKSVTGDYKKTIIFDSADDVKEAVRQVDGHEKVVFGRDGFFTNGHKFHYVVKDLGNGAATEQILGRAIASLQERINDPDVNFGRNDIDGSVIIHVAAGGRKANTLDGVQEAYRAARKAVDLFNDFCIGHSPFVLKQVDQEKK